MKTVYLKKGLLVALPLLMASQAWSSGYEKSVFWSGRYSGIADAASSSVEGSEAIYFNPAGLAPKKGNRQFGFNLSPTSSKFTGPVGKADVSEESATSTSLPFALTYSQPVNEKWAWGVGVFTSAGSNVQYSNLSYPGFPLRSSARSQLTVLEVSPGISYKVNDTLKVGAAYRFASSTASFAAIGNKGTLLSNVEINNIKATNFDGFRLGAQWDPTEHLGFGLNYRNELVISGKGQSSGRVSNSTFSVPITGDDAQVTTVLPMQLTLGAHYDIVPAEWRVFGEYTWTQYSRAQSVGVDSTISFPSAVTGGAIGSSRVDNIEQRWNDQHNIKLAAEYTKYAWPIRFGYVYTSSVTEELWARAVFVPPAPAHTLTLGTGHEFNQSWRLDGGAEYTFSNGSVSQSGQVDTKIGDYSVAAFALHLGTTYTF